MIPLMYIMTTAVFRKGWQAKMHQLFSTSNLHRRRSCLNYACTALSSIEKGCSFAPTQRFIKKILLAYGVPIFFAAHHLFSNLAACVPQQSSSSRYHAGREGPVNTMPASPHKSLTCLGSSKLILLSLLSKNLCRAPLIRQTFGTSREKEDC